MPENYSTGNKNILVTLDISDTESNLGFRFKFNYGINLIYF